MAKTIRCASVQSVGTTIYSLTLYFITYLQKNKLLHGPPYLTYNFNERVYTLELLIKARPYWPDC